MKAKRKRHDPEFKARVALEALKGVTTIQQIAKDFDVHPVQVSDWKKTLAAGLPDLFTAAGKAGKGKGVAGSVADEQRVAELHAKIGQLAMEVDFMQKKSRQLGL
jgi:transposase